MGSSVHDDDVVGYEVLSEQPEIRLHTIYRVEPIEHTDVIFTGVEC